MEEKGRGDQSGLRLICAGSIVFLIGLAIIFFKEFDVPYYWTPAIVGAALMVAGFVVYGIRRLFGNPREPESK